MKTCNWIGFILLLLSLSMGFFDFSVFGSPFLIFYGISFIGLMVGFMGWVLLRFNSVSVKTKRIGKTGFYGNLAIIVLFFPPLSQLWGTFLFGP
ncbi:MULTISPECIES: hypothetical protein [Pontibacillus]|uniref:MFS transporter n=1 Tax=Pontibacillus chungwhensis TaxID=265426 RepID=A0ABY8V106_9BACI|nr:MULTISPECIES: hypothetical protein [Pontibacillus]MCD5322179.1 hypothetical protein [Pontibacillus sp. HN14]WIF99472.1 hypothetical protein QNI29_07395 [Pontibacillus chungwhensis]